MIIDVSGVILTPGDNGANCDGNGEHFDKNGNLIECCCDECDYLLCCVGKEVCEKCDDVKCPKSVCR